MPASLCVLNDGGAAEGVRRRARREGEEHIVGRSSSEARVTMNEMFSRAR